MANPAASRRVPPRVRHDDRPLSQRGIRQPTLMDAPDKPTLAFLDYHAAHPEVWATFRDIAMRLYRRGIRHYGARCIMEVVRYQTAIRAEGEPFKINNNWTPFYARMLMMQDPIRFKDFFAIRESRQRRRFAA